MEDLILFLVEAIAEIFAACVNSWAGFLLALGTIGLIILIGFLLC